MESDQVCKTREELSRLQRRLQSLSWLPSSEIDDTRFEKLFSHISPHCHTAEGIHRFIALDALSFIKSGASHHDDRLRSVAVRLLGELSAVFTNPHLSTGEHIHSFQRRLADDFVAVIHVSAMRILHPVIEKTHSVNDNTEVNPPLIRRQKIAESTEDEESAEKRADSHICETALSKSSLLLAIQKWTPVIHVLVDVMQEVLDDIFVIIRSGLQELSHFVQTEAVRALIGLCNYTHNPCPDAISTKLRTEIEAVCTWIFQECSKYQSDHQLTLLILIEELFFSSKEFELLEKLKLARLAVSFVKDVETAALVRQRAREVIQRMLTSENLSQACILLFGGKENDLVSVHMNELICSVLMAKTRNALLEAIRMITCVPTIKEQDAIWIQSCLEDLYRISFSTQPISNPTTSTAFNTVPTWLAAKDAIHVYVAVSSVLHNIAKLPNGINIIQGTAWPTHLLQICCEHLRGVALPNTSTVASLTAMNRLVGKAVELLLCLSTTENGRSLIRTTLASFATELLMSVMTSTAYSCTIRHTAGQCLFQLIQSMSDFHHLLSHDSLGRTVAVLFESPEWEMRDTGIVLARSLLLMQASTFQKFALSEHWLDRILLSVTEPESYVRVTALESICQVLHSTELGEYLLSSPHFQQAFTSCLQLEDDPEPLSRTRKVELITSCLSHPPTGMRLLTAAFGPNWQITQIKKLISVASVDDDWEVRLAVCRLLTVIAQFHQEHLIAVGAMSTARQLTEDGTRSVREAAWEAIQSILAADFDSLMRLNDEDASREEKELEALRREVPDQETVRRRRGEEHPTACYDDDDDIYPLRPDTNNEIDCPL